MYYLEFKVFFQSSRFLYISGMRRIWHYFSPRLFHLLFCNGTTVCFHLATNLGRCWRWQRNRCNDDRKSLRIAIFYKHNCNKRSNSSFTKYNKQPKFVVLPASSWYQFDCHDYYWIGERYSDSSSVTHWLPRFASSNAGKSHQGTNVLF